MAGFRGAWKRTNENTGDLTSTELAGASGAVSADGRDPEERAGGSRRFSGRSRRVLATVLFFDVVGSTALASELGDERWGELVLRMRRVVGRELKRGGGREQDFSGDGFLAVFSQPAEAVRTAAAIVSSLHELGLEVRFGVHAGECEVIQGKMRGIAVHIGARVMALGGAAEILVTGTVRDLVVGSGIRFEEFGVHQLKGVEGTWLVYRAVEVDGDPVGQPLTAEVASATIVALGLSRRRRRRMRLIAATAVVGVAGVAAAIAVLALRGGSPEARFGTNSLLRIDPRTGRVLAVVRDSFAVPDYPTHVFAYRGTLWNWDDNYGFIRWDMQTGRVLATTGGRRNPWCPDIPAWDIALGTIWLTCTSNLSDTPQWLVRLDELSFGHLATIHLPSGFVGVSEGWGLGAYWVVNGTGSVVRVDAATSKVTATYSTRVTNFGSCTNPSWYPGVVGPVVVHGLLWFAECNPNQLVELNPATRRSATYAIPQEVGWMLTIPTDPGQLWLFDPNGGTLTQFDTGTKTMGEPIALPGTPESTAVSAHAIWVAAGNVVDQVGVVFASHQVTTIAMPKGVWASSIAVDPASGALWVANNTYQQSHPQWAGPSGP